MKIETKQRIIKWVKKLLNYDETKLITPFIEHQRYTPQLIKHQHIYNMDDWKWVCEKELIRTHIATAMANVLASAETNAIKIEFEPDVQTAGIKVTGTLTYILP